MKRIADLFCDPLNLIKSLCAFAACILIMVYAWFQIMQNFSSDVETSPAAFVELNDTVEAEGYIFRDESIIANPSGGTAVTLVSDSQRVSKGQKIANVYSDAGNASLQDDINRIQRKMDILDKSSVKSEFLVSDISKVDSDVNTTLDSIYEATSKGRISSAISASGTFLVKLNKRMLIVDSQHDYASEQAGLTSEKSSIESRINASSTPVYSPSAGYFYGDVDGYEGKFDYKAIDTMTLSDFEAIVDTVPDQSFVSHSAGKIVGDFVWYVVCSFDASQLGLMEEGSYYKLTFPESSDTEIKMLLYRLVSETSSAKALAIFRSNIIPQDFSYQRSQPVGIVSGKCSGLAIPKGSLRIIDGVKGVYILVGNIVHFRRVEIISEKDGYYIVSENEDDYVFDEDSPENSLERYRSLSLYDNVIIAGKDLFEGKIVG